MKDRDASREAILTRLSAVIDLEAGAGVVRMRLIEDLVVDEGGVVRCPRLFDARHGRVAIVHPVMLLCCAAKAHDAFAFPLYGQAFFR